MVDYRKAYSLELRKYILEQRILKDAHLNLQFAFGNPLLVDTIKTKTKTGFETKTKTKTGIETKTKTGIETETKIKTKTKTGFETKTDDWNKFVAKTEAKRDILKKETIKLLNVIMSFFNGTNLVNDLLFIIAEYCGEIEQTNFVIELEPKEEEIKLSISDDILTYTLEFNRVNSCYGNIRSCNITIKEAQTHFMYFSEYGIKNSDDEININILDAILAIEGKKSKMKMQKKSRIKYILIEPEHSSQFTRKTRYSLDGYRIIKKTTSNLDFGFYAIHEHKVLSSIRRFYGVIQFIFDDKYFTDKNWFRSLLHKSINLFNIWVH